MELANDHSGEILEVLRINAEHARLMANTAEACAAAMEDLYRRAIAG